MTSGGGAAAPDAAAPADANQDWAHGRRGGDPSVAPSTPVSPVSPPPVRVPSPVPKVIKSTFVNAGASLARPGPEAGDGAPPSGIVQGRRASLEGVAKTPGGHGGSSVGTGQERGAPASPASKRSGDSVPLADGWEIDVDPKTSKRFYVNHKLRKWSWYPPVPAAAAAAAAAADADATAPTGNSAQEVDKAAFDQQKVTSDGKQDSSQSLGVAIKNPPEEEHKTNFGGAAEPARQSSKVVVPPLNMHSLHAPTLSRAAPPGMGEPAAPPPVTPVREGLDASVGVQSADAKRSRIEHDREVEELKSEIHLIRSQSKNPRDRPKWEPWPDSAQLKPFDSKIASNSTTASINSASKSKGSPLTKVDISKIRQVPILSPKLRSPLCSP